MGLQSNMNQTISVFSFIFSQSPYGQEIAEKTRQKKQTKKARETGEEALAQLEDKKGKITPEREEIYLEAQENLLKEETRLFQLDPTPENLRQVRLTREGLTEYRSAAAEEQKKEQDRIALSNKITKGLNQTFEPKTPSLTPEEKAAILKKNAGGNK